MYLLFPSAAWSTGLIRSQHLSELSQSTKWDSKHSVINGPRKDTSSIIQEGHIKVSWLVIDSRSFKMIYLLIVHEVTFLVLFFLLLGLRTLGLVI